MPRLADIPICARRRKEEHGIEGELSRSASWAPPRLENRFGHAGLVPLMWTFARKHHHLHPNIPNLQTDRTRLRDCRVINDLPVD